MQLTRSRTPSIPSKTVGDVDRVEEDIPRRDALGPEQPVSTTPVVSLYGRGILRLGLRRADLRRCASRCLSGLDVGAGEDTMLVDTSRYPASTFRSHKQLPMVILLVGIGMV